jgi:hypothetical protein
MALMGVVIRFTGIHDIEKFSRETPACESITYSINIERQRLARAWNEGAGKAEIIERLSRY